MADKQLTEAGWKAFVKAKGPKDGYKDAALLKALAAIDKSERAGAEAQLDALAEADKQAEALRKAYKADKELGGYLDEVGKAVAKASKAAEQAKKAEAESEAGEEEESPALLTTKMVPLLRQVKKGDVTLQALVAVAGKDAAVLLSRKSISAARRKLLAESLGGAGGIKYVKGECLLEEKALTFVVAAAAGGLAKKLKAALLTQTGMRLKVRVRGEDPNDIDEEGEDNESDDGDADGGEPKAAAPQTAPPAAPPAPSDAEFSYTQRLLKIRPALEDALKAQHPEAAKLQALRGFAGEKAAAGDFATAIKTLQMLEKLLATPLPAAAGGDSPAVDPAKAFNERLAALLPKIKEAPPPVKLKASEAGMAARKREFDAAQALLDELEAMLEGKAPGAVPEAAAPSDDPLRRELDSLLARLQPDYDAITRAPKPPAVAEQFQKVRQAWALAEEAAAGGNLERALQILRRLDDNVLGALLEAVSAGESSPPGGTGGAPDGKTLVAYRTTLLDYRKASAAVKSQIASLKSAIPAALPDQRALADELAEALEDQNETLLDAVDVALSAAQDEAAPASQALADTLDEYITELRANPLIQHADNNPFGVALSIQSTLHGALTAIRKAMPVPA